MPLKSRHIRVHLPDDSFFEVSYYCDDKKLTIEKKKTFTQLYIQQHDCICIVDIEKSIGDDVAKLEKIVHNKMINSKGHLC